MLKASIFLRRFKLLALALTFSFLVGSYGIVSGIGCSDGKSDIATVRLRNQLLCRYEKTARPVYDHKEAVTVVIRMVLKYFHYDIHENTFSVGNWMAMTWKDAHLKWDPADFESIKTMHLADSDIWMPDLSVYNLHKSYGSALAATSASCLVSFDGNVACVPPSEQSSLCVGDISKFPFDTHNCTVRFGSWIHKGEEIDLRVANPGISTEDMISDGEWSLEDTNVIRHTGRYKCCPNSTFPSINYTFKIRRLAGPHVASLILPGIALIILTLISFFVHPQNPQRLILCCVNIICQFLYQQDLYWIVPQNGVTVPLLVLFSRDSLLLALFTIVLTVFLRQFIESDKPAPDWISAVVSLIFAFKPCVFILVGNASLKDVAQIQEKDDGANIIETENVKPQDRYIFAVILDKICFFIFFILYLVMFIRFTP